MEQFNTIPTSGNWADIAGILDANFLRCWTALVQSQSLIGLDGSNYKGMYTSASALPDDMTEAGWALVGTSLSALQLYVFNDGATDWALFSNETYNFTSWTEFQTQLDALSSQVATIGSKIGDLTELETTDKSDLVSAINEVKNNASTTAEDTTYEDNYGIGASNVQDAIDKVGFVGTDTEIDLTQYTEVRAYITPDNKWITTNNTYPYYGIFIPVVPNGKYRITGHLTNNTGYAFLKSNTVGSNNATVTTFATGCSRVTVTAGQYAVETAPSDAKYMWVYTTASTTGDRMPQKIESIKESVIEYLSKTESYPTKDSENLVTSGGVHEGISDAVDELKLYQEYDEEPSLGPWTRNSSNSSFVDDGDHNVTISANSSGGCTMGFRFGFVGAGKELHISYHYVKTTAKTFRWRTGDGLTATQTALYPTTGNTLFPAELEGDMEFSFTVESTSKWINLSIGQQLYDGGVQTLQITNFKAWTVERKVDLQSAKIESNAALCNYRYETFEDVWSNNDTSIIDFKRIGNDIRLEFFDSTKYKRCGFDISSVDVGERLYISFTSIMPVKFGVGDTLTSTWSEIYSGTDTWEFTKTDSAQNWLYIQANSYNAGIVLVLRDFKVYKITDLLDVKADVKKLQEYVFTPSSYIPIREGYERYMTLSAQTSQGAALYGNYLVIGFAASIDIYNLETKAKIQGVTLPEFANTRTHSNTISFSGTKYSESDAFPLLYICSTRTETTTSSASHVYVVRIVGEEGSWTSELMQTITLDFGRVNGSTQWVCDTVNNRAWITGSGIKSYICISIPDITESAVAIGTEVELIDSFNVKSIMPLGLATASSEQGMLFFHNRIYIPRGVPSYDGQGEDSVCIMVVNTMTHRIEAVVPLKNFGLSNGISNIYEPESCFIWNDEFYVTYQTFIAKLIQN